MSIYILIAICILLSATAFYIGIRFLLNKTWFIQWLRGTFGIVAVIGAIFCIWLIVNLVQYGTADEGEVIATLSFTEVDKQEYDVEVTDSANFRQTYRIHGDQWQLDIRLIKFSLLLNGGLPAYKLDRLSGRYLSLEQQNNLQPKAYGLAKIHGGDAWGWLAQQSWLDFFQVKYGSATFMPMADGAIYQVRLFQDGLDSVAVNDRAKQALLSWQ